MSSFQFDPIFPLGRDDTVYRPLADTEGLISTADFEGRPILKISPEALTALAARRSRMWPIIIAPPI